MDIEDSVRVGTVTACHNDIVDVTHELIQLAGDVITMRFRFFDLAVSRLTFTPRHDCGCVRFDGLNVIYDPKLMIKNYMKESSYVVRLYLHLILHCIFLHQYKEKELDENYWVLATDMAVEKVAMEIISSDMSMEDDDKKQAELKVVSGKLSGITADRLYNYYMNNPLEKDRLEELKELFSMDEHTVVHEENELQISREDLKNIARKIKAGMEAFSRDKKYAGSMSDNINEAVRERISYRDILKNFCTMGEEMRISDDEFDYVYYSYGLQTYGNIPLVEPLEYKEDKKIKDFVIALDTSASCRGETVQKFLTKTYNILAETESFFSKINLHIIQCDDKIRQDIKISDREEFDDFLKNGRLTGFGGTDYVPVFEYVDTLIAKGEFENLKGLIYFTDGYGIYPEKMPAYEVMFAFLYDDSNRNPVPGWAMEVILEDEPYEH